MVLMTLVIYTNYHFWWYDGRISTIGFIFWIIIVFFQILSFLVINQTTLIDNVEVKILTYDRQVYGIRHKVYQNIQKDI